MQFHTFASATIDSLPITAKTRENYRGAYRRYIAASLGAKPIQAITRQEIRDLLVPLPPQTGYQTLMVLKSIFREAIEAGIVDSAPTDRVRSQRISVAPQRFLKWDEVCSQSFGRYTDQVRFLALHGLRWGEAAALLPSDIHSGRVFISRSIHGSPKSAAGVRSVPYLGYFDPFSHDRRGLAKALAPHEVTIHSLRKSYAYLLKTSGIHVSTAQKLLGHASPHLTLSVYTQVLDDEIDRAGDQLRLMTQIGMPIAYPA